jgi:uncharacterized protein YwgA
MEEKGRFKLIQYLVGKLTVPGKVKIQKVIYFLQEACDVDLGYKFFMHYYGPYSNELNDTLQEMKAKSLLQFTLVIYPSSYYGYDIKIPDEKASEAVQLPKKIQDKADKIIALFNTEDAQNMELLSSTHFVRSILKEQGKEFDKESVVDEVQLLKPKFEQGKITEAYEELQQNGLLSTS